MRSLTGALANALSQAALQGHRAFHSLHNAAELSEQPVPHQL